MAACLEVVIDGMWRIRVGVMITAGAMTRGVVHFSEIPVNGEMKMHGVTKVIGTMKVDGIAVGINRFADCSTSPEKDSAAREVVATAAVTDRKHSTGTETDRTAIPEVRGDASFGTELVGS